MTYKAAFTTRRKILGPTLSEFFKKKQVYIHISFTDIQYLFLVGGFSGSAILQEEIRKEFGSLLKVVIPQGVGLAILKGTCIRHLHVYIENLKKSHNDNLNFQAKFYVIYLPIFFQVPFNLDWILQ